jgi:inner membrane protein
MQRVLSSKIMMISLLIVLFLIAFAIIRGTVYERQGNYQRVIQDIARNNVNSQTVLTPFIIVPVTTTFDCPNDKSKICSKRKQVVISPETMEWKNKVEVDDQSFKRGIYRAISYHNQAIMTGRFVLSDKLLSPAANQQVDWSNATMRIYLSDLRGLKSPPVLSINQQKFAFEFPRDEESNPLAATYTHISLHDLSKSNRFDFTVTMDITGTGSLQFLPLGKELSLAMVANWPHPSFFGESLPTKNITSKSFNADWKNTYVANRNSQLLAACMDANAESCTQLQQAFQRQPSSTTRGEYNQGNANNLNVAGSFGVSFIQAVDIYLMTDRAIKYAALFLVITFGAFFLFEILKDLRIHPMQYALVGAALAVFYVLLLSFSEHINFALAYGVSSAACISLMTFYVSYVLKSIARSLLFSTILAAMYGTMFVILQSEDYTLMLGSVLVFVLIAVMMFLTRHVDWYELGQKAQPQE